ncbi:phosphotransferase [Actinokineospora sp. 24-640]
MTQSIASAVHESARSVGLNTDGCRLLAQHATSVYLLPKAAVVARVTRNRQDTEAAERAITLTRWLSGCGLPVTSPLDVEQPVNMGDLTITFWRYYPQGNRSKPEPAHLGSILRDLHHIGNLPVALPTYAPLAQFGATVASTTSLGRSDAAWLREQASELLERFAQLDFALGTGLIHGDAYPGNLLWDDDRVLLGDWDEAATGPRELDLINTYQGARFGRTESQLAAFSKAYGYDVRHWPGFWVLRDIRDLHTLGAFIRRADSGDNTAAGQLQHRLDTLRRGDRQALWRAG